MQQNFTIISNSIFFIIFRDITVEYRKEQQVYELATRDMLTGLYNRYYCEKHINTQVQQLKASQLAAFVLIDLDNFKQVNERYGRIMIGDAYLEHVGSILTFYPKEVSLFKLVKDLAQRVRGR